MSKRIALLVGNSEFQQSELHPLKSPIYDVRALAQVLSHPNLGNYEVHLLENASSAVLNMQTRLFFEHSEAEDEILYFYSGHGITDNKASLFLAANDTQLDGLPETALAYSKLQSHLNECKAKNRLVILDCCYSAAPISGKDGVAKGMPLTFLPLSASKPLPTKTPVQTYIMTASNAHEYAWEKKEEDVDTLFHSHFTRAIIEGIKTGKADLDKDGSILIDELYWHVFDTVRQKTNGGQTPQLHPSPEGYPDHRFKYPVSMRKAFELCITGVQLESGKFDTFVKTIYSTTDSTAHLHLVDADTALLPFGKTKAKTKFNLDYQTFEVELPDLYLLPVSIQKTSHIFVIVTEFSLLDEDEKTLVFKIPVNDQVPKLALRRNEPSSDFELVCKAVPKTKLYKIIREAIPTVTDMKSMLSLKRAKVLFIVDGTMQGHCIDVAKKIVFDIADHLVEIGLPVEFGCLVFGEYLQMITRDSRTKPNLTRKGKEALPFSLVPHQFGTVMSLKKFLEPLSSDHRFIDQDVANALELALQYANQDFDWSDAEGYAILIGYTYPHPLMTERAAHKLLVWTAHEFMQPPISWRDEIDTMKTKISFRLGLWLKPPVQYDFSEQDRQFIETVWSAFDSSETWNQIDDWSNLREPALDYISEYFLKHQTPKLQSPLVFPLLDPFSLIEGS